MKVNFISFLGFCANVLVNSQLSSVGGITILQCSTLLASLSLRENKHLKDGSVYGAYSGSEKLKTALKCFKHISRVGVNVNNLP